MLDDAVLLRSYAEDRAQAAFAELVKRHVDAVYSSALRRVAGDAHLAEEVTQDVFAALAQKAGSLSRHPILLGWLYAVTRNEAVSAVRRERRRRVHEEQAHCMMQTQLSGDEAIDWSRLAPLIDDAIDHLGATERAAVLLRFMEKRAFNEIGRVLGLSEDAARMRVDRALEKLRRHLRCSGVTSTAAALSLVLGNHLVAAAPAGLVASLAAAGVGAGGTGGALAGIIQFMSTTKVAAGVAGVTLCLTLGVSSFQIREQSRAAAVLSSATREAAAAARQVERLEQAVAASARERRQLETELAEHGDERLEAGGGGQAPRRPAGRGGLTVGELPTDQEMLRRGQALLAESEEARQLIAENHRAQIAHRFAPLFEQLSLTPSEIEAFYGATDRSNVLRFGSAGGLSIAIPPANGDQLSAAETATRVNAVLGEERFRIYQEFERSYSALQLVSDTGGAIYRSSTPLTRVQAEQLTQVLTQSSSSFRAGGAFNVSDLDWAKALTRAAAVLSPSQLKALVIVRERQHYQKASRQAQSETFRRWQTEETQGDAVNR